MIELHCLLQGQYRASRAHIGNFQHLILVDLFICDSKTHPLNIMLACHFCNCCSDPCDPHHGETFACLVQGDKLEKANKIHSK